MKLIVTLPQVSGKRSLDGRKCTIENQTRMCGAARVKITSVAAASGILKKHWSTACQRVLNMRLL